MAAIGQATFQRRAPKQIQQQTEASRDISNALDIVGKALQIGQTYYGIKSGIQDEDFKRLQAESLKQRNEGINTQLEIAQSGLIPSQKEEPGSILLKVAQGAGQAKEQYYKPQSLYTSEQKMLAEAPKLQQEVIEKQIKGESDLRREYENDEIIKDFKKAAAAYGSLDQLYKGKAGGVNDLALITTYAKIIDPGSVVREGDIQMPNSSQSMIAQFQNYINKAVSGKVDQNLRDQVYQASTDIMKGKIDQVSLRNNQFADLANQYKFKQENVIVDPTRLFKQNFEIGLKEGKKEGGTGILGQAQARPSEINPMKQEPTDPKQYLQNYLKNLGR